MTPNRTLDETELATARTLLADIRTLIDTAAGADEGLRFALNRKVYKELSYDERGKPNARASLKARMVKAQAGQCAQCAKPLPESDTVLDLLSVGGRLCGWQCARAVPAVRPRHPARARFRLSNRYAQPGKGRIGASRASAALSPRARAWNACSTMQACCSMP